MMKRGAQMMNCATHLSSVLRSPFSLSAAKHGLTYTGDKLDDVTVVVSRECDISPLRPHRLSQKPSLSQVSQQSRQHANAKAQSKTCASLLVQVDHAADAFKLAYSKIYIGMSCYQYIPVYTLPGADLPVFYHL